MWMGHLFFWDIQEEKVSDCERGFFPTERELCYIRKLLHTIVFVRAGVSAQLVSQHGEKVNLTEKTNDADQYAYGIRAHRLAQ